MFGVAFVLLWEAVVKGFDLKPYFLPAPSAVLDAFVGNLDNVWGAGEGVGNQRVGRPGRRRRPRRGAEFRTDAIRHPQPVGRRRSP